MYNPIRRIINYFKDSRLSEPALLQKELERHDRENPGWDDLAHRAALRAGLEDGNRDREHFVRLYGEEMVIKVESELY